MYQTFVQTKHAKGLLDAGLGGVEEFSGQGIEVGSKDQGDQGMGQGLGSGDSTMKLTRLAAASD